MHFNKIKVALILGMLLCFTMRFDLSNIVLTDKLKIAIELVSNFKELKRDMLDIS
jgi:hypothetical protein